MPLPTKTIFGAGVHNPHKLPHQTWCSLWRSVFDRTTLCCGVGVNLKNKKRNGHHAEFAWWLIYTTVDTKRALHRLLWWNKRALCPRGDQVPLDPGQSPQCGRSSLPAFSHCTYGVLLLHSTHSYSKTNIRSFGTSSVWQNNDFILPHTTNSLCANLDKNLLTSIV